MFRSVVPNFARIAVVLLVVGSVVTALWLVFFVPQFFQSPHATQVCWKGGCGPLPPSEYWVYLVYYSFLFLVLPVVCFGLGWRFLVMARRSPRFERPRIE